MRIIKEVNTKYMRLSLEIQTKDGKTHSIVTDFHESVETVINDIQGYARRRFYTFENLYQDDFKPEVKTNE